MGVPNNPTGAGQVSKEGGALNYHSSRLALVVLAKRARSLKRGALVSLPFHARSVGTYPSQVCVTVATASGLIHLVL